eukprot:7135111-Heterocapsa_arctica.AAC.1
MGQRIRRPSAFQGLTKKEARTSNIPEGDFAIKEEDRVPPMSRTLSARLKTILRDSLLLRR